MRAPLITLESLGIPIAMSAFKVTDVVASHLVEASTLDNFPRLGVGTVNNQGKHAWVCYRSCEFVCADLYAMALVRSNEDLPVLFLKREALFVVGADYFIDLFEADRSEVGAGQQLVKLDESSWGHLDA